MAVASSYKGKDVMIFKNTGTTQTPVWKAFMWAQNHNLNMNGETGDISSKDHGIWKASELTAIGWEFKSDYIFSTSDNYWDMVDTFTTQTTMDVAFGVAKDMEKRLKEGTLPSVNGEPWELDETKPYHRGNVQITAIELTANNGEKCTFSATMTGAGVLDTVKPS